MFIIWVVGLLYTGTAYLLRYYIPDTHYLTFSFIIFTVIVLFFVLLINYTKIYAIIYTSFLVRLAIMLIDIREGESVIPHSGGDSENHYQTGIEISNNISLLGADVYGGVYSKFLGVLFYMYGDDRIFAQFMNIIFIMTAILIVVHIFRLLDLSDETQFVFTLLLSFFPHSLIFGSILIREAMIVLMVVSSLYFFIRWFRHREGTSGFLSIMLILLGASFHTAVVGILIGYLFGFIFYRHSSQRFKFSLQSMIPFSFFAVIMTYILVFPDVVSGLPVFNKVDQVFNDDRGFYETVSSARGGSAYLESLEVNNLFQLLLYSPIKIIYFITSPMPWNIGDLNELIAFALDGVFYLFALAVFIKNFRIIREKPILVVLLISIMISWFIFGIAVSNAGTAVRHRFKFFSLIVVVFAVIWDHRKSVVSVLRNKNP